MGSWECSLLCLDMVCQDMWELDDMSDEVFIKSGEELTSENET